MQSLRRTLISPNKKKNLIASFIRFAYIASLIAGGQGAERVRLQQRLRDQSHILMEVYPINAAAGRTSSGQQFVRRGRTSQVVLWFPKWPRLANSGSDEGPELVPDGSRLDESCFWQDKEKHTRTKYSFLLCAMPKWMKMLFVLSFVDSHLSTHPDSSRVDARCSANVVLALRLTSGPALLKKTLKSFFCVTLLHSVAPAPLNIAARSNTGLLSLLLMVNIRRISRKERSPRRRSLPEAHMLKLRVPALMHQSRRASMQWAQNAQKF